MSNGAAGLIVIFLILVVYVSVDSKRKHKAKLLKKLKSDWGKASNRRYSEDEYERIAHYYKECEENADFKIDDITWNDLNMDGVFKRMNIANSSIGQEYLYKMLRIPEKNMDRLNETNRLAEYYASNEKERIELQKEFVRLGFVKHLAVSDYIGLLVNVTAHSNIIHYFAIILMLAAVFVCLFINPVAGIALIIASVTFSIITYYRDKAEVEPYFVCVTQIVRMVETAEKIAEKNYSALADYNESLKKLSGEFTSVTKNVWLLESGSVNGSLAEMLLDYVRMLTHVDLIKFNHVVRHIGDRQKQVYELMDTLGFLEACMCVSSFRESLDYWVRPEFTTGHSMQLEEAYHPLVENPVCNSITADRHVLLTGSNASGKSTFLRTVAINALLSQTINTSLSKRYRAPFYRIYSSMSLKDDLSSSNSYYIVEIKSLKRILDAVDDSAPVLMFVDEVLRGTNTVERIAASSEILRSLKNKNALCFAATHDIELTTLLKDCYDNYHFQEEVTDSDVKFNFKLFKGPATTRNAIKLLQIIGYDSKIIQSAESQAGYFLENGSWRV